MQGAVSYRYKRTEPFQIATIFAVVIIFVALAAVFVYNLPLTEKSFRSLAGFATQSIAPSSAPSAQTVAMSDWPQPLADRYFSSSSPDSGPVSANTRVKWIYQDSGNIKAGPVVGDGMVFFVKSDGKLEILDAETGESLRNNNPLTPLSNPLHIVYGGISYTTYTVPASKEFQPDQTFSKQHWNLWVIEPNRVVWIDCTLENEKMNCFVSMPHAAAPLSSKSAPNFFTDLFTPILIPDTFYVIGKTATKGNVLSLADSWASNLASISRFVTTSTGKLMPNIALKDITTAWPAHTPIFFKDEIGGFGTISKGSEKYFFVDNAGIAHLFTKTNGFYAEGCKFNPKGAEYGGTNEVKKVKISCSGFNEMTADVQGSGDQSLIARCYPDTKILFKFPEKNLVDSNFYSCETLLGKVYQDCGLTWRGGFSNEIYDGKSPTIPSDRSPWCSPKKPWADLWKIDGIGIPTAPPLVKRISSSGNERLEFYIATGENPVKIHKITYEGLTSRLPTDEIRTIDGSTSVRQLVDAGDYIYAATDTSIHEINVNNFQKSVSPAPYISPKISVGGSENSKRLFIAHEGGVAAMNVSDHAILWKTPLIANEGYSNPVISGKMLFAVVQKNMLVAFDEDTQNPSIDILTKENTFIRVRSDGSYPQTTVCAAAADDTAINSIRFEVPDGKMVFEPKAITAPDGSASGNRGYESFHVMTDTPAEYARWPHPPGPNPKSVQECFGAKVNEDNLAEADFHSPTDAEKTILGCSDDCPANVASTEAVIIVNDTFGKTSSQRFPIVISQKPQQDKTAPLLTNAGKTYNLTKEGRQVINIDLSKNDPLLFDGKGVHLFENVYTDDASFTPNVRTDKWGIKNIAFFARKSTDSFWTSLYVKDRTTCTTINACDENGKNCAQTETCTGSGDSTYMPLDSFLNTQPTPFGTSNFISFSKLYTPQVDGSDAETIFDFKIEVRDAAENTDRTFQKRFKIADWKPPKCTVISPTSGSTLGSTKVELLMNCSDNLRLDEVSFYVKNFTRFYEGGGSRTNWGEVVDWVPLSPDAISYSTDSTNWVDAASAENIVGKSNKFFVKASFDAPQGWQRKDSDYIYWKYTISDTWGNNFDSCLDYTCNEKFSIPDKTPPSVSFDLSDYIKARGNRVTKGESFGMNVVALDSEYGGINRIEIKISNATVGKEWPTDANNAPKWWVSKNVWSSQYPEGSGINNPREVQIVLPDNYLDFIPSDIANPINLNIKVRAFDAAGNAAETSAKTITIIKPCSEVDKLAPTISQLTGPANGEKLIEGDAINVTANFVEHPKSGENDKNGQAYVQEVLDCAKLSNVYLETNVTGVVKNTTFNFGEVGPSANKEYQANLIFNLSGTQPISGSIPEGFESSAFSGNFRFGAGAAGFGDVSGVDGLSRVGRTQARKISAILSGVAPEIKLYPGSTIAWKVYASDINKNSVGSDQRLIKIKDTVAPLIYNTTGPEEKILYNTIANLTACAGDLNVLPPTLKFEISYGDDSKIIEAPLSATRGDIECKMVRWDSVNISHGTLVSWKVVAIDAENNSAVSDTKSFTITSNPPTYFNITNATSAAFGKVIKLSKGWRDDFGLRTIILHIDEGSGFVEKDRIDTNETSLIANFSYRFLKPPGTVVQWKTIAIDNDNEINEEDPPITITRDEELPKWSEQKQTKDSMTSDQTNILSAKFSDNAWLASAFLYTNESGRFSLTKSISDLSSAEKTAQFTYKPNKKNIGDTIGWYALAFDVSGNQVQTEVRTFAIALQAGEIPENKTKKCPLSCPGGKETDITEFSDCFEQDGVSTKIKSVCICGPETDYEKKIEQRTENCGFIERNAPNAVKRLSPVVIAVAILAVGVLLLVGGFREKIRNLIGVRPWNVPQKTLGKYTKADKN